MDSDTSRLLLTNNDEIDNDNILSEVSELQISDNNLTSKLGVLLNANKEDTYSTNKILKGSLTLRECNELYRHSNGSKYSNSEFAEFDRCVTRGCISPLRRFDNAIGHFTSSISHTNINEYSTICLQPQLFSTIDEFSDSLEVELNPSIRKGYLWSIQNCNLCLKTHSDTWIYNNEMLPSSISSILDILCKSFAPPLSVHTQHAWLESQDIKDIIYTLRIFKEPEETTAVTGILGTLQNNQLIDLAQEDKDEPVNKKARYKNLDIPGFLCAGHTAHSMEAGRVRRVCHGVSVRVMNQNLLQKLFKALHIANKHNTDSKHWILFCMGKLVYCNTKVLISIRNYLISSSSNNINTCTLHINSENHTAMLSISSGVVLRRDMNNLIISTTSIYSDRWPDNKYTPVFPDMSSDDGFKFHFSGFFQLIPYIAFDRPPRTLISSVQSVQAVTTPFGAGTSSVAPTHTSRPLVSTPFIEELIGNTKNHAYELPDLIPGEDLMVCFANFNDTNEDSIMMSEGSIARSLFSYMAYSVHVVHDTEKIPDIDEYVNMEDNRWWKCYSRRLRHDINSTTFKELKQPKNSVHTIAGGDGRGKVISKSITQTGDISVKVLRYSTPVTGDKLATGHGQKGVIKLIPECDMPWGIDENGEPIKFDIVISLSSISNRITTGQYYEMVSGTQAVREGKRLIISPSQYHGNHTETVLYDGKSGNMIERCSPDGDIPVLASWGINRIWQMTQLTWDKQHYTHNTAGKYSITTSIGRTAGGGIRFGEMEGHAIDASGLTEPYRELKSRMDLIDVQICINCDKLAQICSCESTTGFTQVSIPHSMLIFDYANLLTSGYVTKYKLTF